MPILSKKQMTEEDIKLNYITPAIIQKGWSEHITMETKVKFTAGRINIKGSRQCINKYCLHFCHRIK